MNPLFQQNNQPAPNVMEMMNQFNQFRQTFQGNPQQAVMNMLQQGTVSNQQFQSIIPLANQMRSMIGR